MAVQLKPESAVCLLMRLPACFTERGVSIRTQWLFCLFSRCSSMAAELPEDKEEQDFNLAEDGGQRTHSDNHITAHDVMD
ncbi:hypothetical protein EYF80_003622 [Liparis tanakae]|uniref:Uncharacterized protein n=1 Tax=Liparis tanakae TaxID=230148 RepID=A0A4Z2J792_9TELE|nr:hypothetical protein EYF80_003622 [Liparis tanakae]